jgi:DNA-binding response OmpR family regulator
MIKLLLIEDDANLGYIIKSSLEEILGGYEVVIATNGEEGLLAFEEHTPDLIVSDIDMPVLNGIEMVRRIRQTNQEIPIVFASGKTSSKDVTLGYEVGVNNYIKKPFLPEELDAHIKALLQYSQARRYKPVLEIYKLGCFEFNPKLYFLSRNGVKQNLTARESQLLEELCKRKGEVVPREDLLKKFWGIDDYFTSRSLDVFISKMRKYLSGDATVSIKNIKGVGLILECFS